MYDYSKLKGKIVEVYGNQYAFAEAMGMVRGSLSNKLRGKTDFNQKQIMKAIDLLGLDNPIPYFFTEKV